MKLSPLVRQYNSGKAHQYIRKSTFYELEFPLWVGFSIPRLTAKSNVLYYLTVTPPTSCQWLPISYRTEGIRVSNRFIKRIWVCTCCMTSQAQRGSRGVHSKSMATHLRVWGVWRALLTREWQCPVSTSQSQDGNQLCCQAVGGKAVGRNVSESWAIFGNLKRERASLEMRQTEPKADEGEQWAIVLIRDKPWTPVGFAGLWETQMVLSNSDTVGRLIPRHSSVPFFCHDDPS